MHLQVTCPLLPSDHTYKMLGNSSRQNLGFRVPPPFTSFLEWCIPLFFFFSRRPQWTLFHPTPFVDRPPPLCMFDLFPARKSRFLRRTLFRSTEGPRLISGQRLGQVPLSLHLHWGLLFDLRLHVSFFFSTSPPDYATSSSQVFPSLISLIDPQYLGPHLIPPLCLPPS